uniref:Uncharacterized protein n=1 Tax=Setaria viridis TaxID=4556 RepID=A0A4U6V239_SETVI|nr:hypothetical protein SEVIR_4G204902v2 [Setaria viridis]
MLQQLLGSMPLAHVDDVCDALVYCMEWRPSMASRFLCAAAYGVPDGRRHRWPLRSQVPAPRRPQRVSLCHYKIVSRTEHGKWQHNTIWRYMFLLKLCDWTRCQDEGFAERASAQRQAGRAGVQIQVRDGRDTGWQHRVRSEIRHAGCIQAHHPRMITNQALELQSFTIYFNPKYKIT